MRQLAVMDAAIQKVALLNRKLPPKEILAKRLGEPRSRRIKTAVKSPESAVYQGAAEHSSFQHFSISALPKSPFSPPPVRLPALLTAFTSKANSC
jgi:hypothetical protein